MIQMIIVLFATVASLIIMCGIMLGVLNVVNLALANRKQAPLNALQSLGLMLLPAYVVTAIVVKCLWLYFFG